MVKLTPSTKKEIIYRPQTASDQAKDKTQTKHQSRAFFRKERFFPAIHGIYWFTFILVLFVAGSSIYYLSLSPFKTQFLIKRILPDVEYTKHKIRNSLNQLEESIRSIPLTLNKLTSKQSTQNPEKPTVTTVIVPKIAGENSQKIFDLEKSMTTLESKLNDVTEQLQNLAKQRNDISERLQRIETTLQGTQDARIKKAEDDTNNKVPFLAPSSRKVDQTTATIESIHAIIPGRAWLNQSEGRMITVGIGSYVPNYGVVRVIEPHLGFVQFSSGKIIYLSTKEC